MCKRTCVIQSFLFVIVCALLKLSHVARGSVVLLSIQTGMYQQNTCTVIHLP